LSKPKLNECSAREIQNFAQEIEKTNVKHQQKTDPDQREFSTQMKIAVITRLGIPLVRIAKRLNIHRETISNHAGKSQALFNKIHQEFKAGAAVPDMAQEYGAPQSLVWSVVL
jgi:DNA-binding NarL/FixJ family response regulator